MPSRLEAGCVPLAGDSAHPTIETSDVTNVDSSSAAIDAAWCEEIERRLENIRTGRVQMLDMDEAHAQI